MLLKVVVLLLLCVLGPGPAGSKHGNSKKYFEVELPEDDEYDEGSGQGWGQSPWLEFGQQQVRGTRGRNRLHAADVKCMPTTPCMHVTLVALRYLN